MRGLMIAAVAVAGLTLGGQAQAQQPEQAHGMSQLDTKQGGRVGALDQVQSEFPEGTRNMPMHVPWGRTGDQYNTNDTGTGGSGSLRSEVMEVKGVIRSVSDKGMTITVPKDNDRIVTLRADNQVQLMQNNEPLALSSLKLGDEVRASYEFNEDGQKVIRSLEVTSHDKAMHNKHKK